MEWFGVDSGSVCVEGFPWRGAECEWRRLPRSVWLDRGLSDELRHVAGQPSGGLLRLLTDSPVIGLRVKYAHLEASRQSPVAATRGFDVYLGGSEFCGNLSPDGDSADFESSLRLPAVLRRSHPGLREIGIYLPLQSRLEILEIGVAAGSSVGTLRRRPQKIVFYGSSITQGFCASRPGLTYPARVCRNLGVELVNLGFGGNCRGQVSVARAIAGLAMSALVYDYDHNAESVSELRERHGAFLREILAVQPGLPVVVLSSPNFHNDPAYFEPRRAVIASTCRMAAQEGYRVHFLGGDSLWPCKNECTVDRLHPNDDGFARIAGHVTAALEEMSAFHHTAAAA